MYKKGHTGMIKVKCAQKDTPGTLEIKVRIGGNGSKSGNVKDLKQLSGKQLKAHFDTASPHEHSCVAAAVHIMHLHVGCHVGLPMVAHWLLHASVHILWQLGRLTNQHLVYDHHHLCSTNSCGQSCFS